MAPSAPVIGHLRSDLFPQLPMRPVRGLDLAVEQEVLLGGHVVKEDIVLHADAQLPADVVQVELHVSSVHLDGARRGGKQSCQEGPGTRQTRFNEPAV